MHIELSYICLALLNHQLEQVIKHLRDMLSN